MGFKDLKNKAPKTVDAVAEPAMSEIDKLKAQLAAATKAAEASTVAVVAEPAQAGGGFLSLFNSAGDTSINALVESIETDGHGGGGSSPFPVLTQTPGTSGGSFERVELKDHADADLPEGKKPFLAVFLGYRFSVTAWPEDYVKGVKAKPVFSCAVPAAKSDVASMLMMAGRQFQFSKQRGSWSISAGGPGVIKPQIEMLLLDPTDDSLFVYRCPAHYNSAKDTRDQLLQQASENNGKKSMLPFVGVFTPKTNEKNLPSGNTVVHHYAEISKLDITDQRAREAWGKYQTLVKTASQGVQDSVRNWLNGTDQALTKLCTDALETGSNM